MSTMQQKRMPGKCKSLKFRQQNKCKTISGTVKPVVGISRLIKATTRIACLIITVVAPTAKAAKSVTEVIVILTPACFIVMPMRTGNDLFISSLFKLLQH